MLKTSKKKQVKIKKVNYLNCVRKSIYNFQPKEKTYLLNINK